MYYFHSQKIKGLKIIMEQNKIKCNVYNVPQKDKLKIARTKAKKLDPLKVEFCAKKKLGSKYRQHLKEKFNTSNETISKAFKGAAYFKLFQINDYLKNYSPEKINIEQQIVNNPQG